MSLFDDVKRNLIEWYTVTSEKTSEVARVTSRRYDKFGISRDIERQFSELGSLVYNARREGRDGVLDDPAVSILVDRIGELERELRAKDEEIDAIRRDAGRKRASAAADAVPTVLTDPALGEGRGESAILLAETEAGAAPAAPGEGADTRES